MEHWGAITHQLFGLAAKWAISLLWDAETHRTLRTRRLATVLTEDKMRRFTSSISAVRTAQSSFPTPRILKWFWNQKRRIKTPKLGKKKIYPGWIEIKWGKGTPFFLCVSYQSFEGELRTSKLKSTPKFWISRPVSVSRESNSILLVPKETSPVLQQWFQATNCCCFPESKQWAISDRLCVPNLVRWSSFIPNESRDGQLLPFSPWKDDPCS